VLLTALALPMSWVGYQFHWIRQRHDVLAAGGMASSGRGDRAAPFPLWLAGEAGVAALNPSADCPDEDFERIRRLFSEATVTRQFPLFAEP
jgi:hypothetical protein